MRKALQKLFSLFKKNSPARKGKARKSPGQSMVEFALALPILIMLFSGMVEFGFMLNTYLSLLDATRSAARLCSNGNPFRLNASNVIEDNPDFAPYCAQAAVNVLAPPNDLNARQIPLDVDSDDVLVSVLSITVDSATDTITSIVRHPASSFYSHYGNDLSAYTDTDIEAFMTQNGTAPVQTGMLIVEVYYDYRGLLKLPWVEAFMSNDNPVTLHASTFMPLVAAQP